MLKSDDPPGKPNLIWFDIYNEFNINYDNLKKKYQPKLYREEKNCRRSLYRLTKRGFVKPVIAVYDNFSLQDPRGTRYIRYSLTAKGRAIAQILKQKEKTANINECFEQTIKDVRANGKVHVTLSEIRLLLWQKSCEKFESEEEFNQYWNNTRLGHMIKPYIYKKSQISEKDGKRKYYLKHDTV